MPAIGDQVASLEHDHAAALAQIDSLNATLSALQDSHGALIRSHAAVTADNEALNKYADEIKAMVESVAGGALKMLQAARAPLAAAAPALPSRIVVDSAPAQTMAEVNASPFWKNAAEFYKPSDAVAQNNTPEPPAQQAVAEIMAGDSGDEQPTRLLVSAAPLHSMADHAADATNPLWINKVPQGASGTPTAAESETLKTRLNNAFEEIRSAGPLASAALKAVEAKIADVPEAVERMLHHSSAASTMIRRPIDMTMIVEHTDEGLPMFLRRGTAFDALARERIFG